MNTVPRAHSLGKTYKVPSGVGWHSNSDKPTNLDGAYPAKVSILSKLGSRSTPANTGRVPNSVATQFLCQGKRIYPSEEIPKRLADRWDLNPGLKSIR
jgi:hypothetical protein